ncbi:hypothetical protein WJX72_002778 [[Myrmecia] bisecta]|uniref:Cation/H+ exchanger transmembrane domain-containing protein n=1 Tax=[Myrmecia] bisecta TaxID=41462 RepID=A0AAW1R536_9CHLO
MAGFQRLGGGGSFSRGRSTRHNSVLHGLSTRFPYENFLNLAAMVVLLLVCYGGLFLVFGRTFLPLQGHMWAVSLIWICSHVGGYLTTKVGLPPLLGMLLTGVMLRNVPQDPVQGLPHLWSSKIRTAGLALILMRAGLQLDLQTFRRYRATALLLGTLPVLGEALSASLVFHFMFHMPTFLAISAGFICAAISPTVLVTGMLELQKRGYGSAKGIPSMEMAAAGLDVTLAIAGYSVFIGLAVPYEALGWSIAHGPLSIAFGVVAGACGGLICSCTWLWNTTLKRAAIVLTVGEALMFLGKLASVWNLLAQPLLFGVIGTTLDFRNIRPESAYLPKTVSLIAIGLGARASFALLALVRSEYTGRERLFIALSWLPKATVQGALCSAPLDLILDHEAYSPNFLQQKQWGQEIITTAIFSIIICAPIGLLASGLLGPLWLSKDETLDGQVSGEPGNQQANPFANGRRFDEENVADMAVSLHSKTGRMLGNPFADEPHGDGSPLLLSRMSGSPQRFGERRSLLSAVARSHSDGSVDGDVADVHGPHGMPTLAPPLTPSLSSSGRAASGDLRPPAANPSPHSQPMRSGFRPNSHRRSHSQDIPEAVNLYDDDAEDAQLLASVRMRRSLSSHTEPLPGMRQPNDAGPSSPHVIPKGTMSLEQFLMVAQKSVAANSLPTVHGEDAEESSAAAMQAAQTDEGGSLPSKAANKPARHLDVDHAAPSVRDFQDDDDELDEVSLV